MEATVAKGCLDQHIYGLRYGLIMSLLSDMNEIANTQARKMLSSYN